jgi:hypothetical protein
MTEWTYWLWLVAMYLGVIVCAGEMLRWLAF